MSYFWYTKEKKNIINTIIEGEKENPKFKSRKWDTKYANSSVGQKKVILD